MTEAQIRMAICEVGRRLWLKDLVGGTEGNISARLDENRFLITPSGAAKGMMSPEDLLICDSAGKKLAGSGTVSSEFRLHTEIYEHRPDCQSVVHAHPPVATAMSVAGATIPDDVFPESAIVLGRVALVPFAMPGTEDVADAIRPFLADYKTLVLAHHGACTMGKDVFDAGNRMEILERVANVLLYAKTMGGVRRLSEEAMNYLSKHGLNGRLD
ncbi:class II aldolase/adducin family protein [Kamptonema cortianum]|nr:class II aldolase/adducin family protein [Geitlerinema splendidum]MDK3156092.1 class II aldolase/adducin family protein [Kamptonema cortianum]